MNLKKIFYNKTVIVLGHTGFKGSWLSLWLTILGAKVIGISINILPGSSHFKATKLQNRIKHLKMELVHEGYHDGWVLKGMKEELECLEKQIEPQQLDLFDE